MRIKKFLYSFLKYPLIIIFLKTPFFYILNKRFKFYRKYVAIKNKNFFWQVLDTVYQKEYFDKIIDKDSIRKISDSTFTEGHGKKWAKNYFESHFVDLDGLNNQRVGLLSTNDALPIFSDIINYVKTNKLEESDDTYIIQLGSSSGRDINFFYNIFPKLNYISTDINDEILDYQREQYKHTSLNFYKCHAENIDKCIEEFQLKDKRIILFSSGSLNYVNPYFLKEFFLKIKKYHNLEFFLCEPVNLLFLDNTKLMFESRSNISFSHRYDEIIKQTGNKIIEKKIIRPYSNDDPDHKFTGHYVLHASN